MRLLGISAYYHDSAIALIEDGKIVFAAQEERYSRIKNDASFPILALQHLASTANLKLEDLDAIVFYDKPLLKFERVVESYLYYSPRGLLSFKYSLPRAIWQLLFFKRTIREHLSKAFGSKYKDYRLLFCDHHLSHAAFAFFTSGLEQSALLSIDGVGEWATTAIKFGKGNKITSLYEQAYPNSVGLLFSAFTYFLGFKVNSGEYKLMGLAAYGNDSSKSFKRYVSIIKDHLIRIFEDGSVQLNPNYFTYGYSLRMIDRIKWEKLFNVKARIYDGIIKPEHCDLALAAQKVIEEIIFKLAVHTRRITNASTLCISGGVALNCVANGKLQQLDIFDRVHVPFSPGDSGSAIGAALAAYHMYYERPRNLIDEFDFVPYHGQRFEDDEIRRALIDSGWEFVVMSDISLFEFIAAELARGKTVGWFQGKTEFGPRALGNRSILADPRSPEMQTKINLRIKGRESFRPFAPSILDGFVDSFFESGAASPYMQFAYKLKDDHRLEPREVEGPGIIEDKLRMVRSRYPAVTHIDFTSRIQTVSKKLNLRFWTLIDAFYRLTGCPMLLNTSFNRNDEPIVNTPTEAMACFAATELDILVLNNYIVSKTK